jgi:hypothetical protein
MNYAEWVDGVPNAIKQDSVWKMAAYRLSLFLGDLAWADVTKLCQDRRTLGVSDQLYRAVGSISANLTEGYSRGTRQGSRALLRIRPRLCPRDTRLGEFQRQACSRRSRCRAPFPTGCRVIRLILAMIPDQRGYALNKDEAPYHAESFAQETSALESLLKNVPMLTDQSPSVPAHPEHAKS